jgi:hypothetical protein
VSAVAKRRWSGPERRASSTGEYGLIVAALAIATAGLIFALEVEPAVAPQLGQAPAEATPLDAVIAPANAAETAAN